MLAMKSCLAVATLATVLNSANAILGTLSAATVGTGTAASIAATFTGLGAAAGTTVFIPPAGIVVGLGGALLLKAAALGALGHDLGRRKRFAVEVNNEEQTDLMIASVMANEPQQCYRRLVCDLATGSLPESSGNVILDLFNKPVDSTSARFDLQTAALVGKQVKNTQACEYRFSCPLTGAQIAKIFS